MSETHSQQRITPARRKPYRQGIGPAAHKAYASENDASTLEATRLLGTPQTPNNANIDSNTPSELSSRKAQSTKSRAKNRPKPKHGPTFYDFPGGGQTPPQRSVSVKSAMNTAFAGATFHASPAPSALPIPSFLSKSTMESPVAPEKNFPPEPSPPTTDQNVSTPFRPSSVARTNESPLDFMFRAHREERERFSRKNVAVLGSIKKKSPETFPPIDTNGFSKSMSLPLPKRNSLRPHSGGIDTTELVGTPGRPMGPAFSTPYQERIKAARAATNSNSPHSQQPVITSLDNPPPDNSTDALKKFLFGSTGSLSNDSGDLLLGSHHVPRMNTSTFKSVSRLSDNKSMESRSNNIQDMENDLRRILKLDVLSDEPSTDRIL